jgi:hypothetical protein
MRLKGIKPLWAAFGKRSQHQTKPATNMAKQYFLKEILGSGFIVQGSKVPWEALDGGMGVVALDDTNPSQKTMIDALAKIQGKYGIVKISEGEYSAKKREHPYNHSKLLSKQRNQMLQSFPSANSFQKKAEGVAVTNQPSKLTRSSAKVIAETLTEPPAGSADPISESFKPSTGRTKMAAAK